MCLDLESGHVIGRKEHNRRQVLWKFRNLLPEIIQNTQRKKFPEDTPLHVAVAGGNILTVSSLLEKGADVNSRNQVTGDTPLHVAAARGDILIVSWLLEKGADVTSENNEKNLPLETAMQNGKGKQNSLS